MTTQGYADDYRHLHMDIILGVPTVPYDMVLVLDAWSLTIQVSLRVNYGATTMLHHIGGPTSPC